MIELRYTIENDSGEIELRLFSNNVSMETRDSISWLERLLFSNQELADKIRAHQVRPVLAVYAPQHLLFLSRAGEWLVLHEVVKT